MDPAEVSQIDNTTNVSLEAALSIADARALYTQLNTALAGSSVSLDGGRVERLDAAAMQVLASFCHTARERGLAISWKNISPGLKQAARMLGLESILGMTL